MRGAAFIAGSLGALTMGVIYDQLERITGIELTVLLWAAIAVLILGVWFGLFTSKTEEGRNRES